MLDTPVAFNSPEDVCKRAMQHVGVRQSDIISLATPTSQAETECATCYDKLRRAELRRNKWVFSTRKAPIRPIVANMTLALGNSTYTPLNGPQTGSLFVIPSVWSASVNYTPGAVVMDPSGNSMLWTSSDQENMNNAPGAGAASQLWDTYFGPIIATPFDPQQNYWAGELVYVQDPNTAAINVYRSLTNANGSATTASIVFTQPTAGAFQTTSVTTSQPTGLGNPWIFSEWNPIVTYNREQVVEYEFSLWRSMAELNCGNVPGVGSQWTNMGQVSALGSSFYLMSALNWLPIPCTVQSLSIPYPLGAGPLQEQSTRNAYRLPAGYLREAPQDPTAGAVSSLGAPSGLTYNDWQFEGKFLTTRQKEVILFRFIADITKVADMDDMFCEGLAARIGAELCETLTQSTAKIQTCTMQYNRVMGEARIVNAIESGSDQPPEDDYILCRL